MSTFGDLVSSIGSENRNVQPIRLPSAKPTSSNPSPTNASKSAPPTPSTAASSTRPVYRGTARTPVTSQQGATLKRKAEEISPERPVKIPKPNPSLPNSSDRAGQKPSKGTSGGETISPTVSASSNGLPTSQNTQNAARPPAKPPARGSYAEIMARAKEAAQSKTPSQVGVIKHQATEKTKVSKMAERKRTDQEKGKAGNAGPSGRPGPNGKGDPRRRSVSPVKPTKKADAAGPKQPKAPQPPLHGPARPQAPAYKGTLGQAPKRQREGVRSKQTRYNEYLGTDEEDEGDYDDYGDEGDEGGYYSDASSDMEGGFDDLQVEETQALKAAKEDDARELELENRLKKEKLDRKQKLAALAAKRR